MPDGLITLLLEITADPSKAEAAIAGLSASTVAESRNISGTWSSAMSAMTGPTGIALGAITGLVGGMVELANKAAETGSQIFEASEKTGIGADKLSGLMALTKETGGSFDGLTMALARAEGNLEKATTAGDTQANVLARVMGGAKNLDALGLKPMDERMQILLKRIFALNDVGDRNAALSQLLGRGWMQNVAALKMLAEQGYGPAIEKAKQFGIFFDDNAARQARQMQLETKGLTAELSGLGLELGQKLLPAVKTAISAITYEVVPGLESWGLKIEGVALALSGNFGGASLKFAESTQIVKKAMQDEVDGLIKLDSMTRGATKTTEDSIKTTNTHTRAVHELNDVLSRQLEMTRQTVAELESADIPARQKIEIEIERQVAAATREIAKDRELYAHKKITLKELQQAEKEYSDLVVALAQERHDKLLKLEEDVEKKQAKAAERLKRTWAEFADGLRLPRMKMGELAATIEATDKALGQMPPAFHETQASYQQLLAALDRGDVAWDSLTKHQQQNIQAMRDAAARAHELRQQFSGLSNEEWNYATTSQRVAAIVNGSTTAAMESSLSAIAGLIGGRKLQAQIEGAYYIAKGAVDLAEGIWPVNPALIAKGLGEIAGGLQLEGVGGGSSARGGGSAGGAPATRSAGSASKSGSAHGSAGTLGVGGGTSSGPLVVQGDLVIQGTVQMSVAGAVGTVNMLTRAVKQNDAYLVSHSALNP